jgi:hypothetical protein
MPSPSHPQLDNEEKTEDYNAQYMQFIIFLTYVGVCVEQKPAVI